MASVCVLCCEIYEEDRGAVPQVDKLSEAVSRARGNAPEEDNHQDKNVKLGKLVCGVCAAAFETAILQKEEVISKEKQVRKLQTMLLRMMRQLEGSITGYREQMTEVEQIMKDSHQKINHIDTYFTEMGTKEELKEAIGFRNDFFSVVRELRDFGKTVELPKAPEEVDPPGNPPFPAHESPEAAPEAENESDAEIPGTSGDPGRDEGQLEVPSCSSNEPRALPVVVRPCSVILQRIAVSRTGDKYSCSKCGRVFKKKGALHLHRCSVCRLCKMRFPHRAQMEEHFRLTHPTEQLWQWSCHECTPVRHFPYSSWLLDHQEKHHWEKMPDKKDRSLLPSVP